MPDQILLDLLHPLLSSPLDQDEELHHLLTGLVIESWSPDAMSGVARPVAGRSLDFALSPAGASWRLAGQAASLPTWQWPARTRFRITAGQGEPGEPQLRVLELELEPATVRLPFLRAARREGSRLLPDPAQPDALLRLEAAVLEITPAPGPGPVSYRSRLRPGALDQPEDEPITATMEPAVALVGPLDFVGLGVEQASVPADLTTLDIIELEAATLFAAVPGAPALATVANARNVRLELGAVPGVSGDFEITPAQEVDAPARPGFLSDLRWTLRLSRNVLTAFQVQGRADIEHALQSRVNLAVAPGTPLAFTLAASFEDNQWRQSLRLSPGAEAGEGNASQAAWSLRRGQGADDLLDRLGVLAVFGPLLSGIPLADAPAPGALVSIGLTLGMTEAIAQSNLVRIERLIVHGGELHTRPVPGAAAGSQDLMAILMLDVEVALTVQARVGGSPLIESDPQRPLVVRHHALGLRLDFGDDPQQPTFAPFFDPGQGYELGISDPGMFQVPGRLGDLLQVLGARMARTNPLSLELDVGLAADLGVVSVDRARVRIPLPDGGALQPPSVTALGVGLNLGALRGRGYLAIGPGPEGAELTGGLDVILMPPGLRVAAGLSLAGIDNSKATAVFASLRVEFPVPIPLYTTGLGLYGLAGLFAMHKARAEDAGAPVPALHWFEHVARGDPGRVDAWSVVALNRWSFGVGAVLGTMEGGFIANLNGMLVLDLPGPRLVLFMGAQLLMPRPGTTKAEPGQFLAVVDIGPDAIRVGITAQYGIPPLYEVRVPAHGVFHFQDPEDFELDLGTIRDPVTVKYLFVFRGSGYLMIHGRGIQDFPLGPLHGLSVAVGAHASLTWGAEEVGLYLRVTADLDVGVSFHPFLLLGRMGLKGELHLFIVGLEVSAAAEVAVVQQGDEWRYHVKAEVCGKVEFLFFDVEGCVTLELGDPPPLPPAPPLVRAVSLHSRPPAVILGSTGDQPVNGSLGDAAPGATPDEKLRAPVDAIPVIQFEMAPRVVPGVQVLGKELTQPPLPPSGWTRRGERFYRYTLTSVTLDGPLGEGEKPWAWWHRQSKLGGDDNNAQLALLTWDPDATPVAVPRSVHRDRYLERRWGTLCIPIADAAPVLWTFHAAPVGTSTRGWVLQGEMRADPPDTWRSAPPPAVLRVTEAWRTPAADGRLDAFVDALQGVSPGRVSGGLPQTAGWPAGRVLQAPVTGVPPAAAELQPALQTLVHEATKLRYPDAEPLADGVRLDAAGELDYLCALIYLSAELKDRWVARALDREGHVLVDGLAVDWQQLNGPGDWLAPDDPWFDPVAQAWQQAQRWLWEQDREGFELYLACVRPPEGTSQVELGLQLDVVHEWPPDMEALPRWLLLAVEGLPTAEFLRRDYDETVRRSQVEAVNGALGADLSQQALLHKDTTYRVAVQYTVEIGEPAPDEDKGQYDLAPDSQNKMVRVRPVDTQTPPPQQFAFRTAEHPPRRLDPWVLATNPAPDEGFHFWGEPIGIVFATNAVRQLYAAYGRKLRAIVRAATFRHNTGAHGGAGIGEALLTHALLEPGALVSLAATATALRNPWEEAMLELKLGEECVPAHHQEPPRHERVSLNLKLDPMTDYVFDVEAEPGIPPIGMGPPIAGEPGEPSGARLHHLFRRAFKTSRYETLEAMVQDIASVPLRHRLIGNPGPLEAMAGAGPVQLSSLALEQALRDAGLGGLPAAADPRLILLWQPAADGGHAAGASRPVALLLDLPEPLWRTRPTPYKHVDPDDPARTASYELRPETWLSLQETAPGAVARGIVVASGGARMVVLLHTNAQGRDLRLEVRRELHPLLDGQAGEMIRPLRTITLGAAPWEVEA